MNGVYLNDQHDKGEKKSVPMLIAPEQPDDKTLFIEIAVLLIVMVLSGLAIASALGVFDEETTVESVREVTAVSHSASVGQIEQLDATHTNTSAEETSEMGNNEWQE